MKFIHKFFLLLSSIALFSCTDEAFIEGTPSKGLTAQIPSFQFDNQTRVNISPNLSTFTWSDGDKIGIYQHTTYNDASAVFRINQGGSSSGVFSNESFSLKPNSTYYAFYPYDSDATIDSYPIDFTGQIQTKNGGTEHIGARNYMSSEVNTDANGAANISFQNQAAVIQVAIPIEEVGIYTGVTLSSTADDFIIRGTMDMKTGEITPTEKKQQMELSFGKGIAFNEGDILVANFLVAPTDLTGKYLTVRLTERNGESVSAPTLGKKIEKGKAYRFEEGKMIEIPYLTFTANDVQALTMSKAVETLEYSVNFGEWKELGTNTVEFGGSNGDLRLRGKSSIGTAKSSSDYSNIIFSSDVPVSCSGDIRTLVDYEKYTTTSTENSRFCCLFSNCKNLTKAPELPATILADHCYLGMFEWCTSLVAAPALLASSLARACYANMFYGCTNLTSISVLPATTLAWECYCSMFEGCTSLTAAPDLPANTLALSCYSSMFKDCSNLKTVPKLPATTLEDYCYLCMFKNCTSLTAGPELPASTLAGVCYESMFEGCTSLTTTPALPATTLTNSCYTYMFYGCTDLTNVPELPATKLAYRCYDSMFKGCTNLSAAPALPATSLAEWCYASMFSYCTNLTTVPLLPATSLAGRCYMNMFEHCTNLTTAPELPATTLVDNCYDHMFYGCSNLNYIKMMAKNITAWDCLFWWTASVSPNGTFVKNSEAIWTDDALDGAGYSIIPSGWSVEYVTE